MTCPDCAQAERRPWYGFRAGCQGCAARSVARSPQYFHARRTGRQDAAYRDLLARTGVTHDEAIEAARKDAA